MPIEFTAFEPGASLARIRATCNGWRIDCRGPKAAQLFHFVRPGEAAEMAVVLQDHGWRLRFAPGSSEVEEMVREIAREHQS